MPDAGLPLYHQVKASLRQAIEAGLFRPGESIPPERELTDRFGVSRITIRQAIADLVAEGLLVRHQGKGTFVSASPSGRIAETLSELTGHLEELQRRSLQPEVDVLDLRQCPLPDEVAEALQRPAGLDGWFLYRRVLVDGRPLMLSEVYLPSDLGIRLDAALVQQTGMAQLLAMHGHLPDRGVQRIGAEQANVEVASRLELERQAAVLRVVRLIVGRGGRPLVWLRTYYHSERYEYEVELTRRR